MGHLVTLFQKNKIIVQDGFNRPDDASTLGKANTGQVWTTPLGVWGILGNAAKLFTPSGGVDRALINSGLSDCSVKVVFSVTGVNQRVIFRYTDATNEWAFGSIGGSVYELIKRVAGVVTTVASSAVTIVSGDMVKVLCAKGTIRCFVNGSLIFDVSDSSNQTATTHGIFVAGAIAITFDNFLVEAL